MCVCVCVCVCVEGGLLQGQNELMLNIPYWFYCNSFLILSLFNFISLRLLGMEMRSVLLFFFPSSSSSSFFFFLRLCKLQLSPQAFWARLPRWPCVVCLKFYFPPLPAFPSWLRGERRGSWEASWRLWARPGGSSCGKERSGGRRRRRRRRRRREELGRERWGGVDETGAEGVVVCMCMKREGEGGS